MQVYFHHVCLHLESYEPRSAMSTFQWEKHVGYATKLRKAGKKRKAEKAKIKSFYLDIWLAWTFMKIYCDILQFRTKACWPMLYAPLLFIYREGYYLSAPEHPFVTWSAKRFLYLFIVLDYILLWLSYILIEFFWCNVTRVASIPWCFRSQSTILEQHTFLRELWSKIRSAQEMPRKFSTEHQAAGWDRSWSYFMSKTGAPEFFSIAATDFEFFSLSRKYCIIALVFRCQRILCTALGSQPFIFWQCPPIPGVLARVSLIKRSRKLCLSILINLPRCFMNVITRE